MFYLVTKKKNIFVLQIFEPPLFLVFFDLIIFIQKDIRLGRIFGTLSLMPFPKVNIFSIITSVIPDETFFHKRQKVQIHSKGDDHSLL